MLQFFGSAVNVHLQAPRTEVAICHAEGYTERVGYDRKRWEELGRFGVEKMDHSCRGKTLSDGRGCVLDRGVDRYRFVGGHAHGMMEKR